MSVDYEIEIRNDKTHVVKEETFYPKTYHECIKILDNEENYKKYRMKLEKLSVLLFYRNVYWKIAGEQMGLGRSWEPDWCTSGPKYVIAYTGKGIEKQWETTYCKTFALPDEEMRNTFYENFKDLIEHCKEFL